MDIKRNLSFCGISVGPAELELIEGTIRDCAGLSRTELAYTVCELLDWRRPNGGLKGHECRQFLEALEAKGILRLPAMKGTARRGKDKPLPPKPTDALPPETIEGELKDLGPVVLEQVRTQEDRRQWREWVERHHYIGYKVPFGAHLRYFVLISRPRPQRVGCLQVSSPAWRMAPRDQWIGWDEAQRVKRLQQIVQNSRFLILPWVKIPNLASAALGRLVRQVADDWQALYCVRPVLMETLVDPSRFRGTCYLAANWLHLGQTTGRGRQDKEHQRHGASIKDVLVYPLCRKARAKLLQS